MNSTMLTSRFNSHWGDRKRPLLLLLLLLCLFSLPRPTEAAVDNNLIADIFDSHTPQVGAANQKAGLVLQAVLPELIGNNDVLAQRLGFGSANDVAPPGNLLGLDHPYPVVVVELEQLQSLPPAQPPPPAPPHAGIAQIAQENNWLIRINPDRSMSIAPAEYLYPILFDGSVASSVWLGLDGNDSQWNIHRIGSKNLIRPIHAMQRPGGHFIVHVPALNRYYLGLIAKGPPISFTIKAIFDDPRVGLHAGQTAPAWSVFMRLRAEAKTINLGDPNYPPR